MRAARGPRSTLPEALPVARGFCAGSPRPALVRAQREPICIPGEQQKVRDGAWFHILGRRSPGRWEGRAEPDLKNGI